MANRPQTIESETERAQRNAIFTTLSHPRRRFSLRHLRAADTPVKVRGLAKEIAAWEGKGPAVNQSDSDTDEIEVALVHNHLPKMNDAGVVKYSTVQQTVALTDSDGEIESHLEMIDGN